MRTCIQKVIIIYVTPGFLKRLAEEAQGKWDSADWGDDLEIGKFWHKDLEVRFVLDQEKMPKEFFSTL